MDAINKGLADPLLAVEGESRTFHQNLLYDPESRNALNRIAPEGNTEERNKFIENLARVLQVPVQVEG